MAFFQTNAKQQFLPKMPIDRSSFHYARRQAEWTVQETDNFTVILVKFLWTMNCLPELLYEYI